MRFTIPTRFTAIDMLSGPVRGMSRAVGGLVDRLEQSERRFNDSKLGKRLEFVQEKTERISRNTAIAGAAIATPLALATSEAIKFEKALGSFRTIVSDLSDSEFANYRAAIKSVGRETRMTYTDVAESFEKIAGLNASFAATSEGISTVSNATITLAKASGDDLGVAAENLVGIMNQFSLTAGEADRAINVLAAGQSAGAASITQAAEAYKNFGSVASGSNLTLEDSMALIQTVGKYSLFGAEAGTKLRGSILKLQQAGKGYASGQFNTRDALLEVRKQWGALGNEHARDALLLKTFGAENISTGKILVQNVDLYNDFTKAVSGTSEAQKAASITTKTMSGRLDAAKATLANMATEAGEKLAPVLEKLVDKLVPVIDKIVSWMGANPELTTQILTGTAALAGLLLGISAVTGLISIVTKATWLWQLAQGALNLIMTMNPIGLIVVAIAALIAIIAKIISATEGWGETWSSIMRWMGDVWDAFKLSIIVGWEIMKDRFLSMVDGMVRAWYWFQNKIGLLSDDAYTRNIKRIDDEKAARLNAIAETSAALERAAHGATVGPEWKVRWKDDDSMEGKTAFPTGAINPMHMATGNIGGIVSGLAKMNMQVQVSAAPGTQAEVTGWNGMAKPAVTTTMGFNKH